MPIMNVIIYSVVIDVPTADTNWRPCPMWDPTPSHPRFLIDLETRGFAVFLCFLVCILVKIDSR